MARHVSLSEAATDMARNNWGYSKMKTMEEAQKKMKEADEIPTGALLELLRLADAFVSAIAASKSATDEPPPHLRSDSKRPRGAVPIPGVKVGDMLYQCSDLEDGVERLIVVWVGEGDYCKFVHACSDDSPNKAVLVYWAWEECFRTAAEALRAQAEEDVTCHKPKIELAEAVLAAVAGGKDLSKYLSPGH